MQGLQAFKNQHSKLGDPLTSKDEDSEDDGLSGDEEEFKLLSEKMNHINLLRQANSDDAAALVIQKKNGTAAVNGGNNSQKNSVNIPNQNQGLRNPNGSDQVGFNSAAASNKMVGGGNFNGVMSGLQGFGHNGLEFQQHQSGLFPAGSYPSSNVPSPSPMMMNLQGYQYQNPASSMMMKSMRGGGGGGLSNNNLMMHESRFMQPQVMYNMAPQIPSCTGYYCYQACPPSPYLINQQQQPGASGGEYGDHLFSDENTNNCTVM